MIIPEAFIPLLTTQKSFAHLATVMPDGTPQVTPVWIDFDGSHVLVNTAVGRLKDRNLSARAEVGLSICDPDNPYRYLAIRGRVVERSLEGAEEHIDTLAQRYLGSPYPFRKENEVRVLFRVEPLKVSAQG